MGARVRTTLGILLSLVVLPQVQATPAGIAAKTFGDESAAADSSRFNERIGTLLLRSRTGGDGGRDASVRTIAKLGPQALPALLRSAVTGSIELPTSDGAKDLQLQDAERELLRDSVRLLGRPAALPILQAAVVAAGTRSLDELAATCAMEGLALTGKPEDLRSGIALTLGMQSGSAEELRLRLALERAVESVVRRDAAAVRMLSSLLDAAVGDTAGSIVRGMVASGRPEVILALTEELDRRQELLPVLLSEIASAARSSKAPADPRIRSHVRSFLDGEDLLVAATAATAAGALDDHEAVPHLIALLASDDKSLRKAAESALRVLTGSSYGTDRAAWSSWLDREQQWFELNVPRIARTLAGNDPGKSIAALREIPGHRWRRPELVELVTPALANVNPGVRVAACTTLMALGSMDCAEKLVACLDDTNENVASAAWSSLVSLSGRDLPRDRADCAKALGLAP